MPNVRHDGDKRLQTPGRRENAAQPLDAADDNAGAERYPEPRSFAPPRTDQEGRLGPAGDPAEGKRD